MKRLLLAALVLASVSGIAQNKNDNVIIVKGVTFKMVINNLLDAGYQIQKMDTAYSTVRTEYKKLCSTCEPEYLLDIRVKDSTAIITGKWKNTAMAAIFLNGADPVMDIRNEKSGVPKQSFAAANKFALSLSSNIVYAKQ